MNSHRSSLAHPRDSHLLPWHMEHTEPGLGRLLKATSGSAKPEFFACPWLSLVDGFTADHGCLDCFYYQNGGKRSKMSL